MMVEEVDEGGSTPGLGMSFHGRLKVSRDGGIWVFGLAASGYGNHRDGKGITQGNTDTRAHGYMVGFDTP